MTVADDESLQPQLTVEASVLDGFGNMVRLNERSLSQISNRPATEAGTTAEGSGRRGSPAGVAGGSHLGSVNAT